MLKKWMAIFCAAMLALVAGCGNDAAKDAPVKKDGKPALTVGLMPDTDSVPFIVAREKGFFEAEGVEVTLRPFKSAMDRDAAMQSGQLDGAISDLLAAAFALEGGFDVRVTSATDGSYQLVAGVGTPAGDARALAGAEVAVSRNTIIEYVTDRILKENGMASDAIQKVSVPQIPARLEMLQNGKLTAATLPEPMASVAVANGCKYLTGSGELGINPGVMLFSAKAAAEKKDALRAMYRAYNKAVDYLKKTPRAEYIGFVVEKGGFPEAARDALKLPDYRGATLPKEKDVAEVVHWLREKSLIKKDYDYRAIVVEDCLP
ncbi:MAG: ABC transporter substrate-binding protein [Schwartzia sp.]|nr:ABC transporter substrate-binding protein [Schwartzia sp. (in: firmicutes)]MBR1885200.1 ABC transporter substrate-binding protein [Schwartzia sp. (in: firmicutes)]